jgi:Terpene cyclase DEP1
MWIRALLAIALTGFLALTARAFSHYSYFEFLQAATANAVVSVMFFDLVIGLSLIAVRIYRDARRLEISPWPYIAIGASLGVAGPLLYLLRRPRGAEPAELSPVQPTVLLPVLGAFTAATAFAVYRHGYTAFVTYALSNEATQLLFVDLALSLTLVAVWMVRDARARKAAYLPFLALAFLFGSVGPLLYLVGRGMRRQPLEIA